MPSASFVNMYKYFVLYLCVSLSGVLCDLNKQEGAPCEWNGVKGKCVKETQCLSTLDSLADPHLVCSTRRGVTIICCTDCKLVQDTRNIVMSPTGGYFWKDGTKARDTCLQYLRDLPYKCREGGFYSGISMNFDEEKKCHTTGVWSVGGTPPPGYKSGAEFPHLAMLGYGEDLASAEWLTGGAIISKKYILTAATVFFQPTRNTSGKLKYVAVGVEKSTDQVFHWQTHNVKRCIPHPDYKAPNEYNDIALIETVTPITFNKNVLPACLHVEEANDETAIAPTWRDRRSYSYIEMAATIQTINLKKFTEEECKSAYGQDTIDYNTQMCYGSNYDSSDTCWSRPGEPLLINTQFSRCVYTVIGVTSFGVFKCNATVPDVYTRVAYYKPWIESIVWA